MPLDVVGQKTNKHMSADSGFQMMKDRPNLEVCRLEATESLFYVREILVGLDHRCCCQFLTTDTGPDDIETVELSIGFNCV